MQKKSTPTQKTRTSSPVIKSQSGPRRKTIDFLRQFARIYHFEPQIGGALGGMMMN